MGNKYKDYPPDPFPRALHEALSEIAKEYGFELKKETHFEAFNRVLLWYGKKKRHRLDFTFVGDHVSVAHYIDLFPSFIPSYISIWAARHFPWFIYCAKIQWYNLSLLSIDMNKENYIVKIKSFIEKIISELPNIRQ